MAFSSRRFLWADSTPFRPRGSPEVAAERRALLKSAVASAAAGPTEPGCRGSSTKRAERPHSLARIFPAAYLVPSWHSPIAGSRRRPPRRVSGRRRRGKRGSLPRRYHRARGSASQGPRAQWGQRCLEFVAVVSTDRHGFDFLMRNAYPYELDRSAEAPGPFSIVRNGDRAVARR